MDNNDTGLPPHHPEVQSTLNASTLAVDIEKQPYTQSATGNKWNSIYGNPINTAFDRSGVDCVYAAKAKLLNEAMLDIGMGRYQWTLFLVTGIGWFLDNFWITSVTIILPAAANEAQFFFSGQNSQNLMVSLFTGLTLGAATWPALSDHVGRKSLFTSSIVLVGMAGLVGAGMTAFTGLCIVAAILGFAVGGNQAVDAIYLIESLPANYQWLVTLQGVFWGLGELVAYAIGWAFIEMYTCGTGPDEESTSSSFAKRQHGSGGSSSSSSASGSSSSSSSSSCHYVSNKGWRYTWWCFGCITLFLYLLRFFFRMRESPKFLLSQRRDAEAVQVIRDIANDSKKISWLHESSLARVDTTMITEEAEDEQPKKTNHNTIKMCMSSVIVTQGFLGLALLSLIWAVVGLALPLQDQFLSLYLSSKGVSEVTPETVTRPYLFSRYVYIAICAIPGPLFATFVVESKYLGRKRSGALLSLLAGFFMLVSGVSRSRDAELAFRCILSFLQYALIPVATTYTVEVFHAPIRGLGLGVAGFVWRLFGLVAWIIVANSNDKSGVASWLSGALMVITAAVWMLLPMESRAIAAA